MAILIVILVVLKFIGIGMLISLALFMAAILVGAGACIGWSLVLFEFEDEE